MFICYDNIESYSQISNHRCSRNDTLNLWTIVNMNDDRVGRCLTTVVHLIKFSNTSHLMCRNSPMEREMGQNGKMVGEAAIQEEYVNSFRRGSFGMA